MLVQPRPIHEVVRLQVGVWLLVALLVPALETRTFGQAQPAAVAQADQTSDPSFVRKAARLADAVYRRPRPGPTLDLWWQHYAQYGQQDRLVEQVTQRASGPQAGADEYLVCGLLAERQARWADAISAYTTATQQQPDQWAAHWRLATVYVRTNELEAAAASFERCAIERIPRNDRLAIAKQQAAVYQRLGRRDDAIKVWLDLGNQFRADTRIVQQVAERLQALNAQQHALELWQQLIPQAKDPQARFEARQHVALLQLKQGATREGLDSLQQLLAQVQPDSWRATELRVMIDQALLEVGDTDSRVRFWRDYALAHPRDLATQIQLAVTLQRVGRSDEALAQFERTLAQAPENEACVLGVVDGYWQRGEFAKSIERMTQFATQGPVSVERLLRLADLQSRRSDIPRAAAAEQAIATWQQVTNVRGSDASLALTAADAARSAAFAGRTDVADLSPRQTYPTDLQAWQVRYLTAAEAFLRQAVRRDRSPLPLHALAEFLHRMGHGDQAIQIWHDVARASASSAQAAQVELAKTLARYGYDKQAIRAAEQAVAIESPQSIRDSQAAWQTLIELQLAGGDPRVAVTAADQMRQLHVDDWPWQRDAAQQYALAVVAAGMLDVERRRMEDTVGDDTVDNSLVDMPDNTPTAQTARWTLALLLEAAREFGKASALLESLVGSRVLEDDVHVLRFGAAVARRAENPALTITFLERLLAEPRSRNADDFRLLAELQIELDQIAEARQTIARWARAFPAAAEPHLLAASVSERSDRVDDQLQSLQQAISAAPDDLAARRQYIDALRRDGQPTAALTQVMVATDLAATLAEKQSLLAWTLEWADDTTSHQFLLTQLDVRRLRDLSGQADHARLAIYVAEQTNQWEDAVARLSELHARFPQELGLLSQWRDASLELGDLKSALEAQRRLVAAADSPEELQRYARLLRRADQPHEAARIWDQVLTLDADQAQLVQLTEAMIRDGDLYRAQQLAEVCMTRQPRNWKMAYQATLIHLALNQRLEAFHGLQQLLTQTSIAEGCQRLDKPADTTDTNDELDILTEAVNANSRCADIGSRRLLLGNTHARTIEAYFQPELFFVGNYRRQRPAALNAAVFWIRMANQQGPDHRWAPARALIELDAAPLRVLLVAAWSTADARLLDSVASALRKKDAGDPLLHWVNLLTAPREDEAVTAFLARTTAAYHALRPTVEPATLHRIYHGMLALCENDQLLVPLLGEEIKAGTMGALAEISQLVSRFEPKLRSSLAAQLIAAAAAAPLPEPPATIDTPGLGAMLTAALQWDELPLSERMPVIVSWLPSYLLFDYDDRVQRISTARSIGTPSSDVRSLASAVLSAHRAAQQRRPRQSGPFPLAQSMVDGIDTGAGWRQVNGLARALATNWHRPPDLESATVVATDDPAPRWSVSEFPQPNELLSSEGILMLQRVAERVIDVELRQELLQRLNSAAGIAATNGASSAEQFSRRQAVLVLTQLTLRWLWGEQSAAVDQMVGLASAQPARQTDLARMLLLTDRLAAAQSVLSAVIQRQPTGRDGLALNARLHAKWGQRLHWRDLEGHRGAVLSLTTDAEGSRLFSAGVDGLVRVWSIETGQLIHELSGHDDIVVSLAVSPLATQFASAGYDRTVRIWDFADGRLQSEWRGMKATVRAVAFSQDGSELAAATDDGYVHLWDVQRGAAAGAWKAASTGILVLRFEPDGKLLLAGRDGQVSRWDLGTHRLQDRREIGRDEIRDVVDLPGSVGRVAAAGRNLVWFSNQPTGEALAGAAIHRVTLDSVARTLAISPAGTRLFVGRDDHLIQVWDIRRQTEQFAFSGHSGRVQSIVVSPPQPNHLQRPWLASAGLGGTIKMWHLDEASLTRDGESDEDTTAAP